MNREAAIALAVQVNNVIRVLANRTRDLDGTMSGGYLSDIESLQSESMEFLSELVLRKLLVSFLR